MKVPNGILYVDGSAQARTHGAIREQLPQIFFFTPQILLCSEKAVLNMLYDKNKNLSPKNVLDLPPILKPGYGPGSTKIVSAIRLFCFEGHSASKCSTTSTTFLINDHQGAAVRILGEAQSWAATALLESYQRTKW